MIPDKQKKICLNLLKLFKIEGQPANEQITEGQLEIFYNLVFRPRKRLIIITPTQYGKSLITALACIIISTIQEEVVSVIAPTTDKAKIIMRYYIEHLGDNLLFFSQLEKNTKLERLRQEESKERIILRNGGGIFVVSVQAGNTRRTIEAAMGLGSRIVIGDENCLIPDPTEATVFRMIAGRGKEAFYGKIGNPFYRNPPYTHFYKSWRDPSYQKVFIDYKQGLQEQRYSEEFIAEARNKPHFNILFECKFPPIDAIDSKGYMPLLSENDLDTSYVDDIELFGELRLGVDVAGGGSNNSVIVLKGENGAKILYKANVSDTMTLVGEILKYVEEYRIKSGRVFIDTIGVGKGVYDRLAEQLDSLEKFVVGVNVGNRAEYDEDFINLKAQAYWRTAKWIQAGGKLKRDDAWEELLSIKYKTQSDKKIKIKTKDEMIKDGIASPDVADALMLTFTEESGMQVSQFIPKLSYSTRRR